MQFIRNELTDLALHLHISRNVHEHRVVHVDLAARASRRTYKDERPYRRQQCRRQPSRIMIGVVFFREVRLLVRYPSYERKRIFPLDPCISIGVDSKNLCWSDIVRRRLQVQNEGSREDVVTKRLSRRVRVDIDVCERCCRKTYIRALLEGYEDPSYSLVDGTRTIVVRIFAGRKSPNVNGRMIRLVVDEEERNIANDLPTLSVVDPIHVQSP